MQKVKLLYIISLLFLGLFILPSCEKWLDVNLDPDSPDDSKVTERVLLPGILTGVTYELTAGYPARYPNYWIGQLCKNAESPDETTFDIDESDVNNTWTYTVYTQALKNNVILTKQAQEKGNKHYLGISQVVSAYILAVTTDLWGSIPWSEAFQFPAKPKPVYDTQDKIYTEIFKLLDLGIQNLETAPEGQLAVGDEDLLFAGDLDRWIKLAYSLKARFAMHLTYAPGKTGAAQADIALAALTKGLGSNADDAEFSFPGTSNGEAPWNQWLVKWEDDIWANKFMVDLMNANNDPRREVYFELNGSGVYAGSVNGHLFQVEDEPNFSRVNESTVFSATASVSWITFAELKFIEAEANLWKNKPAEAKTALDAAIRANMQKWGIPASEIQTYITGLGSLPVSFEKAQQMIIEQKYIANFLSLENWNDFRRTGYPLVSAANTEEPFYENIPVRFPYCSDSKLNNPENTPVLTNWSKSRIWWDAKAK